MAHHAHLLHQRNESLLQHGVLSRERRDIPLSRVNDHCDEVSSLPGLRHSADRTLTIESAGGTWAARSCTTCRRSTGSRPSSTNSSRRSTTGTRSVTVSSARFSANATRAPGRTPGLRSGGAGLAGCSGGVGLARRADPAGSVSDGGGGGGPGRAATGQPTRPPARRPGPPSTRPRRALTRTWAGAVGEPRRAGRGGCSSSSSLTDSASSATGSIPAIVSHSSRAGRARCSAVGSAGAAGRKTKVRYDQKRKRVASTHAAGLRDVQREQAGDAQAVLGRRQHAEFDEQARALKRKKQGVFATDCRFWAIPVRPVPIHQIRRDRGDEGGDHGGLQLTIPENGECSALNTA